MVALDTKSTKLNSKHGPSNALNVVYFRHLKGVPLGEPIIVKTLVDHMKVCGQRARGLILYCYTVCIYYIL